MMAGRGVLAALAMMASAAGLVACGGAEGPAPQVREVQVGPQRGQAYPLPSASTPVPTAPQPSPGAPLRAPQSDSGYSIDTQQREAVRLFFRSVHGSSIGVASGWNGTVAHCAAGDTSEAYKAAVLRRINWYRAMAGVPGTVQLDATYNQRAQQAAMLMSANSALSHYPPANWACHNATASTAAANSNLALGSSGPEAIDGYMRDSGTNNAAVGHRRWLLYPQTRSMGTGDVDGPVRANAVWVFDGNFSAPRPAVRDGFVAWPPPGYVPYQTVFARWSFSYPQADFSAATLTVTQNGVPVPVQREALASGVGENTLVWIPSGLAHDTEWPRPAADTPYQVTVANVLVAGVPRTFSYSVVIFDPDAGAAAAPTVASASASGSAYALSAVAGATSYQWRALSATPYELADGAEAGTGNFIVSTSGYDPAQARLAASGNRSFRLAHTQQADQVLQLRATLHARPEASLSFSSRLGLAGNAQTALVEISGDEGATWAPLYQQAGQQSGVTSSLGEQGFTARTISLAAWAGRTFHLRLRFALGAGTYYVANPGQPDDGVGWYVDDIRLTGVDAVTALAGPADATGQQFALATGVSGDLLLQGRANMYGYAGDWGAATRVAANPAASLNATADCLFDWAERNYRALFAPASTSLTLAPYYYRYYAGTNIYLGVSSADQHVYYLKDNVLNNAGAMAGWAATAGCR